MPAPKELYEKLGTLNEQSRNIIKAADDRAGGHGKGVLTAEENAKFDAIAADMDKAQAEIESAEAADKRRAKVQATDDLLAASAGRRSDSNSNRAPDNAPKGITFKGRTFNFPAHSQEAIRSSDAYHKSFEQYLATGVVPSAGLVAGDDRRGGYLAPIQTVMSLIKFLDDEVFMRKLANVLPPMPTAQSIGVPSYDTDPSDADWTAEVPASAISEDTGMTFGKREMTPHLITKLVKSSRKLLRVAQMDMEGFINQRLGYKHATAEENAFMTGTGAQRPLGVFTASNDGVPTTRDITCAATTTFTAAELINCLYQLKAGYQRNATWIFHRDAIKIIRKMVTGDGQFLWQPGLQGGQPATIFDRPYVMSEFAPNTFTTGQYVGICADFKTGYWIVDSLAMEIQMVNELFAGTNQVGFYGRKETDGMPVLAECFSRLKLA